MVGKTPLLICGQENLCLKGQKAVHLAPRLCRNLPGRLSEGLEVGEDPALLEEGVEDTEVCLVI